MIQYQLGKQEAALTEMDKLKNELYQYLSAIESKIDKKLSLIEGKQSESFFQFQKQLDDNNVGSSSLNDIVMQQKVKFDKIEELEVFRRKGEDQLISHEIRLNNLRKEFDRAITKYDRMYIDNLIVPGYIGECAQFKNMREYVDYNIGQVSNLVTAKEKINIDLKDIKSRLDGTMRNFTSQLDTYNKTHHDYANKKHSELQEYIMNQMKMVNDEFVELRMTNCKYAIDLKNKAAELNIEWEKMLNMKDEIYKTFNEKVQEFVLQEKKTNLNVFNMSNEFKNVKAKFNELVQFIKDVRFKKNFEKYEGINKKEIKDVAKKIQFAKLKKAKSLDFGSSLIEKSNGDGNSNCNDKKSDINIDYDYDYYTGNSVKRDMTNQNITITTTQESQSGNESSQFQNRHLNKEREQQRQYPLPIRTRSEPKYVIDEDVIEERNPEEEETKKSFMPQQHQTPIKHNEENEKEEGKEVNEERLFFKKHPNLLKGQTKFKKNKIVFNTECKYEIEKKAQNDNSASEINKSLTDNKSFQSPPKAMNPLSKRSHKLLTSLRPEALKIVELNFNQQLNQPTHLIDFSSRDNKPQLHFHHLELKPVEIHKRNSKKFKTVKESPQNIKTCFGSLASSLIRKTKTNGKEIIDCSINQSNILPNLVLRNYSNEA